MRRKILLFTILTVAMFTINACAGEQNEEKNEPEDATGEIVMDMEENPEEELKEELEEESEEKPERLNPTYYENLPKFAEQIGYSFRALDVFTNGNLKFGNIDIFEEVDEVNGMELEQSYPVVRLKYVQGIDFLTVTIFPYNGENVMSAIQSPACYVSTKEINGIEVGLSEYIMYIVGPDFEKTEEDTEFVESGKGCFSVDSVGIGTVSYFRSMYWVEDGIYYELENGRPDTTAEKLEELVKEFMEGEWQ